ncbi:MAG: transglycosylase SLT domain-containing protein [Candidatus Rokubacteria bacterium]|nr:transglycosylase SLT domain-containing protein [Candidatus Rokubacteria bacterium]
MRALATGALLVLSLATFPAAARASGPPSELRLTDEWRDRFIAALAQYRAGDWVNAAPEFARIAAAPTPLTDHALYLEADSLARSGDPAGARARAERAVASAGEGQLAPIAQLLAAEQAVKAADAAGAVALTRAFVDRYPDHAAVWRARFMLAESLEATGQLEEAARGFRHIWLTAPAGPFAPQAVQRERALADRGVSLPAPTPREALDRSERLLAAGRATEARAGAEALLAETQPTDLALRALRVQVEALRRVGQYDPALRAAERAIAMAPPERRATWLLEVARLQGKQGRESALTVLARLVREHPKSPEAAEGLLLRARVLESGAKPDPAQVDSTYARLAAEYSDEPAGAVALWRLAWAAWFRGALPEAGERWGRLAAARAGQSYREAALYWQARTLAERGQGEAAAKQLATMVADAPRSYYGLLAAARLTTPEPAPVARSAAAPAVAWPADPLEPLRSDVRYVKVEALRAVGLPEFAEPELEDIGRRAAGNPVRLYAVAAAHVKESRFDAALRILRRDFSGLARSGDPSAPRAFWEMFYPIGWRAELTEAAGRAAVDPLFVAAVTREESSFNPRATSRVGARGLMQLMPDTARPMARARGLPFRDGELLYDPGSNLDMGASFISNLVKDFGDHRLAVAAYNAGPRRVREWWGGRRSDDLEVFVEQIPFDETRRFVKRVMLSWSEYRRLYAHQ